MKVVTVEVERFEDFKRLAEAQQGLLFVESGELTDTLSILANRPYPLVFECAVPKGSWHDLDRTVLAVEAKICTGE